MAQLSPLMESVLSEGGTVDITVTGNSMFPMLKHRVSRVRLASVDKVSMGDIPLYRRDNGKFVLHRIVDFEDSTYTCCGDNQWALEKGIRQEQLVAVVTDFSRKDKWTSCDSRFYRFYWKTWVTLRPLRRIIFGGIRSVKRVLAGVRH